MDNLTHSLIGVWMAEAVNLKQNQQNNSSVNAAQNEDPLGRSNGRQKLAVFLAAILGANLPDIDIIFSLNARLFSDENFSKLHYLLHHRGFTHTLLGLIVLWPLAVFIASVTTKLKPVWRSDRYIWYSAGLGLLSHLIADSLNDYGVHPFWPIVNTWFHAGILFIVEPVLIIIFITDLTFKRQNQRWTRFIAKTLSVLVAILLLLAAIKIGLTPFAKIYLLAVLMICSAIFFWARIYNWGNQVRFILLSGMVFVFCIIQLSAYTHARWLLNRSSSSQKILSTSPAPANPFCWRVLESTRTKSNELVTSQSMLSLFPENKIMGICNDALRSELPGNQGPLVQPISELIQLANERCGIRRFLQFSRFPYLFAPPQSKVKTLIGDIRYARGPGLGFTQFYFASIDEDKCVSLWAPWDMPLLKLVPELVKN